MEEDVSERQVAVLEAYRLQGLSLGVVQVAWEHAVTRLLGELCQEVCQVGLEKDRRYITGQVLKAITDLCGESLWIRAQRGRRKKTRWSWSSYKFTFRFESESGEGGNHSKQEKE